jgi:hypothetical protein
LAIPQLISKSQVITPPTLAEHVHNNWRHRH